jgi:hypothetical protein
MWKKDPKGKCIPKHKHDHIYIYIENMFATVGLFNGSGDRKRTWKWILLKYIASVKEEGITKRTEICWIGRVREERARQFNKGG